MTKKYEVKIDVTDAVELVQQNEYEAKTPQDIIKYRLQGMKPYSAGKVAIGNRVLGFADDDILPDNKLLFYVGAAVAVSKYEARQMRQTQVNGKEYEVRAYVAPVDNHLFGDTQSISELESVQLESDTHVASDTDSLISSSDPLALQRAISYLEHAVPGHIWGRLVLIAEHGGDYHAAANDLCQKIQEMVGRLEPLAE